MMEHDRGILFMTLKDTKRVGNSDDAFVSRIHSVIEGFSDPGRERIWGQFFTKMEMDDGPR